MGHPETKRTDGAKPVSYPQRGAGRERAARVIELPLAGLDYAEPHGQSDHLTHGDAGVSEQALATTPAGLVERVFAPWDQRQNRRTQTRSPKPSPGHDPPGACHPSGGGQRGAGQGSHGWLA